MPRVTDVVPLWDVGGVVDVLLERLRCTVSVCCPDMAPSQSVCVLHICTNGISHIAHVRDTVSFLFLEDTCSASCSLVWVVVACQLPQAFGWLVVEHTRKSFGRRVCKVLPVLVLCSQSASSLARCCLIFGATECGLACVGHVDQARRTFLACSSGAVGSFGNVWHLRVLQ